ncbi:GNAT family N-acetyltransferase [Lactobacillus sp.]|uniref:GNAT family N-acetyltransferase n=1 Tax=Lactobacillus sp. TaxID=1591 RepID=UPI003EF566F3
MTDQGRLIGKCVYENKGDHWIITTTKVDPAYDGHGLGRQLVDAVVVAAWKQCVKLRATCSYAVKVMAKPGYEDLH